MPRIRSIKPDYWKSEAIAVLSMQTRLTFIALWNFVDDNGVGRDNERLIAAEIYPLEEDPVATLAHVRRSLDELAARGRITRYSNDGKPYFHVTNWSEHQKIDRPNKKRYPLPTDEGSTPLTCENVDSRRGLDEGSLDPRCTPSPGEGSSGAGSREQRSSAYGGSSALPLEGVIATLADDLAPTAATVVQVYVDTCRDIEQVVDKRAKGRIAREAAQLLKDGAPHALLLEAARALAHNGYADIGAEARRIRGASNVRPMRTGRVAEGDAILAEAFQRGARQRPELGA